MCYDFSIIRQTCVKLSFGIEKEDEIIRLK
jgi:hypothetical protein